WPKRQPRRTPRSIASRGAACTAAATSAGALWSANQLEPDRRQAARSAGIQGDSMARAATRKVSGTVRGARSSKPARGKSASARPLVGILMGSSGDLDVMNKAARILEELGI